MERKRRSRESESRDRTARANERDAHASESETWPTARAQAPSNDHLHPFRSSCFLTQDRRHSELSYPCLLPLAGESVCRLLHICTSTPSNFTPASSVHPPCPIPPHLPCPLFHRAAPTPRPRFRSRGSVPSLALGLALPPSLPVHLRRAGARPKLTLLLPRAREGQE